MMYLSRPRRANIVDSTPSICSTTNEVYLVPLSCTSDSRIPPIFSNSLLGESSRSFVRSASSF